ncbi:succinate dehydrogenase / fumarate reductase cytochrome b subunit [Actinoplanes campanulatus]|uniref:Succinate dehydrogenase / fumarate reductase cytochrome b subunit n=1 Tax=Actinoplanes campanulatus TaxID=113559 RepID=A0A7W5ACM3_9ACTN|nr:succinate dehydrogenase / fumarate reductase cytochrome b subunit [Actinoplanes campanulatus]
MAVDTPIPKTTNAAGATARPAPRKSVRPSSVILKLVMAVSGALLVLFLFAHAAGNLKIFVGETDFDHYAEWLRDLGTPLLPHGWFLWLQRIGLLAGIGLHIWAATALTIRAKKARPVKYAHRPKIQGSYAARTMRWGGVIIVLFVIYHILDLTTGTFNPAGGDVDPSARVIAGFAPDRWYVTLFYTLAVVSVGFHLRHGIWSAFRTLGQQTTKGERRAKAVALVLSVVLVAMYLSVPFAVLTGLVG